MRKAYCILTILAAIIALTVTVDAAPPKDRRKQEQTTPKPKPNNNGGSTNNRKPKKDNTRQTSSSSTTNNNKTFTANGVSFVMVPVKGGTFRMGSNDVYDNEKPVHSVTLSDYMIGETEVTQALWKAVMGSNPSYHKGDNLPVENVSWNQCQKFISKLNSITHQRFRLPTEAEWEYAARGGSKSRGYKYSGSDNLGSVAWYGDNSGNETHPVKTKASNELGLYDMSGNVWEWCEDWYDSYPSGSQTNPSGPPSGSSRVDRGGSYGSGATSCRASFRSDCGPSYSYRRLGLRLAH